MPDTHWEKLKDIFYAAVALPSNERVAYVERVCDGDSSLRRRVESLLKSAEETGNFLDLPAVEVAAEILSDCLEIEPGTLVAHYKILSLLGEGGVGKVYLAEDTKLHRKVSLKFLSTNFAQDHERMRALSRKHVRFLPLIIPTFSRFMKSVSQITIALSLLS